VYQTREVAEGIQALAKAGRLLRAANLRLKGEDGPPKDLRRGETVQFMGFRLSRLGNRLFYGFGDNAWEKLEQDLVKVYTSANPAMLARSVIRGWVGAYGPALENERERVQRRILAAAAYHGFREACSPQELRDWLTGAWERWLAWIPMLTY